MRQLTAYISAPLLTFTGYRFSKAWRCEDGTAKNFVYEHLLCTVKANITADTLKGKFKALLIKVGIIKVYQVEVFKMNKGA
tara:strand:- start:2169 stop:2411 length:243 start_codon:yes stop_codon:yes gene_type:complete